MLIDDEIETIDLSRGEKIEMPKKVELSALKLKVFFKGQTGLTDVNLLAGDHIWCLRCAVFGVAMNDDSYCYLHSVDAVMHYCWKVPIRFRCDFERVAPIQPAQNTFHINHNAVRLYFQTMNLTAKRIIVESIDWKFM